MIKEGARDGIRICFRALEQHTSPGEGSEREDEQTIRRVSWNGQGKRALEEPDPRYEV
jgi:hypothetical protein